MSEPAVASIFSEHPWNEQLSPNRRFAPRLRSFAKLQITLVSCAAEVQFDRYLLQIWHLLLVRFLHNSSQEDT
jgi:hypothetical protein